VNELAFLLAIANLVIGFAIGAAPQLCIGFVTLVALTLGRDAASHPKQWRPHAHFRTRVR
jgi:hypothetical protein